MKHTAEKILLHVFLLIFCSSCATTGPSVSSSEVSERRLELEAKAEQFRTIQLKRIQAIAERLISFMSADDQQKLANLRYELSEQADINAFATWGKVGISYGMLRFTESDDELATVIAHELAHLTRGHTSKSLGTNLIGSAIGLAAGAAVEGLTQGSGLGGTVAQGVSKGVSGSFSREFEREADYYGFQYVYLAGFDMLKGAGIWERFAIEAPHSMTASLFSTHPSSPERLIRAEKTLQELIVQGIQPNVFVRPDRKPLSYQTPVVIPKMISAPMQTLNLPRLSAAPQAGGLKSDQNQLKERKVRVEAEQAELEQVEQNLQEAREELALEKQLLEQKQEEIKKLKAQAEEQLKASADEQQRRLIQQEEFERILLEAREASKQLRYQEFGIQDMGVAKNVTNLWVGKKVEGRQRIFSINDGKLDWFAQYNYWSAGSWKALATMHRKFRAYWYAPDGKLFTEQDFMQSKIRAEFAKTTMEWDPALGDRLIGEWKVRIFEGGKLLDERTFELVA